MTHPSVPHLTAPSLAARHGFFTRAGGVSTGLCASLNCGRGAQDDPAAVYENRARVAAAMGVAPEALLTQHQVHSAKVVTVRGPDQAQEQADAMVTDQPGLALGVLTADCAPVLLDGGTVVGAAHAGWQGALDGVIGTTVDAMRALGAGPIRAVVGPCISQAAYEVGTEFFERFFEEDRDFARYFSGAAREGHMMFNLPGFVLGRLRAEGVEADWVGACTYGAPEKFFSYRRATHEQAPDYGRQISVIRL